MAAQRVGIGRLLALLLTSAMAACSTAPPRELGEPIADEPSHSAVKAEPERYRGRAVRWGGEILGVRNADGHTDVEIYARPLFDNAEPQPDGGDGVRFIARVQGFVDPVEYRDGKRLTVRGTLSGALTRPVGDYAYLYPLVAVEAMHLWPAYEPPPEPRWYRDPYYYDPWWPYGPWWPHRHWPYGW
ncbi:MAG: Slp family lipoprotein [Gammaproteobacteria bacterium]|nr:Slp family lipoprotein [Gammaproteobacteria bacterium]MCP5300386.1 Slp family lipoprotein [Chromatiaceae bacterium]